MQEVMSASRIGVPVAEGKVSDKGASRRLTGLFVNASLSVLPRARGPLPLALQIGTGRLKGKPSGPYSRCVAVTL